MAKKQKTSKQAKQKAINALYKNTSSGSGVEVDVSTWELEEKTMALQAIAQNSLKAPTSVTEKFYTSLFKTLPAHLIKNGPLQLIHAVKIQNTMLLEKMLCHWDPLENNSAALTFAVQQENVHAAQILFPLSDVASIAVYCLQASATKGEKNLFDMFEPYIDWAADDCYTARFCALRCADTIIAEERRCKEREDQLEFEKTILPNQYEMLVQIIKKVDYKELERRLHALSLSNVNNTVAKRGEKGLEIFLRAYEESVLKERLLAAVNNCSTTIRRSSKI